MNAEDRMQVEPRWLSACAVLSISGLRLLLPPALKWGPDWAIAVVVPVMLAAAIIAHQAQKQRVNDLFGYSILTVVTLDMAVSLALRIGRLPAHKESPVELMKSAAGLWISNILIFASWYWRLDAGGPNQRERRGQHEGGAFLFPQMTLDGHAGWKPEFIDYLFLAFNTSTAFSPTDAPVLSRWAKALMMVQALISLGTIAVIAARAVNVL